MCSSDIFLGLIAILFPPIAVWIKRGVCSADSLINLALCCLGFIPGLLHAWYIIAAYPESDYDSIPQNAQDPENGTVTYYYVNQPGQGVAPPPQQQRGYGTNEGMQGQRPAGGGGGGGAQNKSQQQHPQQLNYTPSAGPSAVVPPSYEQAVRGDNKVQSQE